ncbi:MAG: glycoside hydrolase family 3 N-terminal domain-containing protein [Legionellaceae bacterium]|nr:glycoside hydrolase family 3 N-terminal domain-containing protein [Legionellaceae bacterium]
MRNNQNVSLRDKIGQMLIVGFDGTSVNEQSPIVKQINACNLGGLILFDYHFPSKTYDKNIETPEQVRRLNADLQQLNMLANATCGRPLLPLLLAVDYEGGAVDRLKAQYGFPETIAANLVGKMSDEEAFQVASTMAKTVKQAGFNLNFAPVLDVNVNPDNPILGKLGRCFSDNATEVARFGQIYAQTLSEQGVAPAYKHFPGHGSSESDSHLGFVDVSQTWQKSELEPYRLLLNQSKDCNMIMTAHIINRQLDDSGLPATLSYKMLTELLRKELDFEGIIITDDMQMKAISDQYGLEESLCLALNAGADMFIFGNQLVDEPQDPTVIIDLIEKNVRSGIIAAQRIDEAYARIIAFKENLAS